MKDTLCKVAYQIPLGENYFRIGLETGWAGFVPGQFGMLEVPRVEGILLRRPFSFARQVGEVTEILYKVVGKGTWGLSLVPEGAYLNLLGPLGHGFSVPEQDKDLVGVAGGYGIAPFLELASQLKKRRRNLQLFYGALNNNHLHYIQELSELDVKLYLTTVDGSRGAKGVVTDLLKKHYANYNLAIVWACGPMGLLKAVQEWALPKKVPCEVSVEESMGCGTGVCLGCVVKDIQGKYRRACIEGPVFSGEDLLL